MKEKRYALGNGVVTDGIDLFIEDGAILINGEVVEKVGKTEDIKKEVSEFIDVKGRLIIPGLLNAHHHLYSFLATGLSPLGEVDNFVKILKNLWWRLDYILDEESIYYSALLGVVDSVKYGVTMIFDHHASMGYVKGSLSLIEEAFKIAGVKGLLCFETSCRMGEEEVEKHIEENLEFWEKQKDSNTIKGMFGLHANLTLTEEALKKISEVKPPEMPIHIHCGEDKADLEYAKSMGYEGPVHRLYKFALLTGDSILAHAIHLSEEDYRIIDEINPIVVSNPESNANNRVGRMDRKKIKKYVLGTDGMTGDMIKTLRSHYLLGEGVLEDFGELKNVFFTYRYEIQRRFFPDTGGFESGMKADIAVLDYVPITPISLSNLLGHIIFGVKGGKVYMTVSNGRILYKDGEITFIDEEEVLNKAKKVAKKLHQRYYG